MTHMTEHDVVIEAAASAVFDIIAAAHRWPVHFPPSVHVEQLEQDGESELIRIWATAQGEVKSWTSRRHLDRGGLRVTFRQEQSQAPVATMSGEWQLKEIEPGRTQVRFVHRFTAVDNDPENGAWIERAIDRNTTAELEALRAAAETTDPDVTFSFQDTVWIDGSLKEAYEFVEAAQLWAERLPHVARVALTEPLPGVQTLEMDTVAADGNTHTTRSVRVCFPEERIVYKQLHMPALLDAHVGEWTFEEIGPEVRVTSRHTVRIKQSAVTAVLGPQATTATARRFVRNALSRNSRATLNHVRDHAEQAGDAPLVPAEDYVSVQQFYARQMRLLDEGAAERWADTFTDDCAFEQSNGAGPVRGRASLAAAVRAHQQQSAKDPQQRRHVFGMLAAATLPDGSVRTRYYAHVVAVAPGGPPVLRLSTTCEDRLVRHGDGWRVQRRHIEHDGQ